MSNLPRIYHGWYSAKDTTYSPVEFFDLNGNPVMVTAVHEDLSFGEEYYQWPDRKYVGQVTFDPNVLVPKSDLKQVDTGFNAQELTIQYLETQIKALVQALHSVYFPPEDTSECIYDDDDEYWDDDDYAYLDDAYWDDFPLPDNYVILEVISPPSDYDLYCAYD